MTSKLRPAVFSVVTSLGISVAGPVGERNGKVKRKENNRKPILPDVEISVWKQEEGSAQLG